MINKTKAALQSCQCHYQMFKQEQNTRVNAGGQSLSAPVISGTATLARLGGMSKSGHSRKGYTALAYTPFPQIWGELDRRAGCTAMQHTQSPKISGDTITEIVIVGLGATAVGHTTEKSRSFDRYPDIGYHSLSATSPRIEVTINPALLSPSSLSDSISATTSCGTRTVKSCDFAFLLEVAITDSFDVWCVSVYAKKSYAQCLKCVSLECSFKTEGETHLTNSEARQCSNTNRASDHNVTEAYIMACIQHTQTRPEFTWRILSASERYPTAKPLVIYVNASSEQEARDTMPGVNLIFAARLPFHAFQVMEVRHA